MRTIAHDKDTDIHVPDVILLDWMMPEMEGPEVLAELKHDERTAHIVVFMLTAKGTTFTVYLPIAKSAALA